MELTVTTPLVLPKTPADALKTLIKNGLAFSGINLRGWKDIVSVEPRVDGDRLRGDALEAVKEYANDTLSTYADALRSKTADDMLHTCEGAPLDLIREAIVRGTIHRRIANIGAAYVKAERILCEEFADIEWDMLDFAENLEGENADVATANMNFVTCYPLEFLESTQNQYDIALFNRVLTVVANREVRLYLEVLKRRCRYIIINESASLLRFAHSIDVDTIDPRRSLPMRGKLLLHNYRAIFAEMGFEMRYYGSFRTPVSWHGEQHFLIQAIARNTACASLPPT